jgi:hypothetical protein
MKSSFRPFSDLRRLGTAMSVAGTNIRKTHELLEAASHVVAKRVTLGAAAMINPANGDHAEFARMVPEKTKAFSEAGSAWLRWSGAIAGQMGSFATREMATAAQAAAEMASCRTPTSLAAARAGDVAIDRAHRAFGAVAKRRHGARASGRDGKFASARPR